MQTRHPSHPTIDPSIVFPTVSDRFVRHSEVKFIFVKVSLGIYLLLRERAGVVIERTSNGNKGNRRFMLQGPEYGRRRKRSCHTDP